MTGEKEPDKVRMLLLQLSTQLQLDVPLLCLQAAVNSLPYCKGCEAAVQVTPQPKSGEVRLKGLAKYAHYLCRSFKQQDAPLLCLQAEVNRLLYCKVREAAVQVALQPKSGR
jgi:hypothetical protein